MAFSQQQFQILMEHLEKIPNEGAFEPNLYFDKDAFEVCKLIDETYWDAERYPGKIGRLHRIREAHKNCPRGNLLSQGRSDQPRTEVGFFEAGVRTVVENRNFSSTGFAAILEGFSALDMIILAIDREKQEFIFPEPPKSYAANDVYSDLNAFFDVDGTSGGYVFLLDVSWDPKNGGAAVRRQAKLQTGVGLQNSQDPVITSPIRTSDRPLDPGAINIGLGRPYNNAGPGSDMDYAWNQPVQNNPKGMIPFVGSARFDDAIQPLRPGENFIVTMAVVNTIAGGGYIPIEPEAMASVYPRFSIDGADPRKLNWNFPPGNGGSPVVFDRVNWPSDMHAIFNFRAIVFLDSGLPAQVTIRSNPGNPANPPDGHLPILPIRFIWHCVAKDTDVLMSDGSKKPIQNIVAGDHVYGDLDFGTVEVLWTTAGMFNGTTYEIATEDGDSVLCTSNHVLVSDIGMIEASEVRIGTRLVKVALGGEEMQLTDSLVAKVSRIDGYADALYNIGIKNFDGGKAAGQFVGNGFLMGDAAADHVLRQARNKDPSYLKSVVPAVYHTDIDSYLQDFS
ncbi:MAG: Hint domain-containing protein [Nisaea sp.]|uniref:Hint domain-containing protein n=1 Tax=Nisaea sp. TaxID=2024842 RepID=UPI00329A6638